MACDPEKRKRLYNEHLRTIREKHFTSREIDVMSCMLHNRKQQRIASLLSITPKTVNTHLYNIVSKLGHNSINIIVDFVERSGKLQYFREYYFHLVIQNLFDQYVRKVAALCKYNSKYCSIWLQNAEEEKQMFSDISPYLKAANVNCTFHKIEEKKNKKNSELDNINIHFFIDKNCVIPCFDKSDQNIVLIFNDTLLPENKHHKYIDFTKKENFYISVLRLLESIINTPEVKTLVEEYISEYSLIEKGWKEMLHIPTNDASFERHTPNKKTFIIGAILALTLLLIIAFSIVSKHYKEQKIIKINQQCEEFIAKYTFENIGVTEGLQENLNLLKDMDRVLTDLDHHDLQEYFIDYKSSSKEVLNYLYSIQSLSMHLLYNDYNVSKSRYLLLKAKNTIEFYVNNRSNVMINFDQCSPEEIYTEISVIKELPQIYSKIMYLLGRTYTYFEEVRIGDSKSADINYEDYEKYYEIAAHIGSRAKIFEGYLSQRNLVEMVNLYKINKKITGIEGNDYSGIIDDIYSLIKTLEQLKADNNTYLLNYRPGLKIHKIIIPSQDNYNKLYLTERIIQHYSRLLKITSSQEQKIKYLEEVAVYFTGKSNIPSIFDELEGVPSKKIACLYNSIGFLMLQFVDHGIDTSKLHGQLRSKLELKETKELELIIELFELAKAKSRNSHYPKLHSYKGLVKSYEKILSFQDLTSQEANVIQEIIIDYKKKIEILDQQLKQNL